MVLRPAFVEANRLFYKFNRIGELAKLRCNDTQQVVRFRTLPLSLQGMQTYLLRPGQVSFREMVCYLLAQINILIVRRNKNLSGIIKSDSTDQMNSGNLHRCSVVE